MDTSLFDTTSESGIPDLAGRTGQLDLVTRLGVAEVVGAHALLGGVVGLELRAPVGGAAHAEGGGLAGLVVTCDAREKVSGSRERGAKTNARKQSCERYLTTQSPAAK